MLSFFGIKEVGADVVEFLAEKDRREKKKRVKKEEEEEMKEEEVEEDDDYDGEEEEKEEEGDEKMMKGEDGHEKGKEGGEKIEKNIKNSFFIEEDEIDKCLFIPGQKKRWKKKNREKNLEDNENIENDQKNDKTLVNEKKKPINTSASSSSLSKRGFTSHHSNISSLVVDIRKVFIIRKKTAYVGFNEFDNHVYISHNPDYSNKSPTSSSLSSPSTHYLIDDLSSLDSIITLRWHVDFDISEHPCLV
jgi:hypothetical protein